MLRLVAYSNFAINPHTIRQFVTVPDPWEILCDIIHGSFLCYALCSIM